MHGVHGLEAKKGAAGRNISNQCRQLYNNNHKQSEERNLLVTATEISPDVIHVSTFCRDHRVLQQVLSEFNICDKI
jgi:hypothetical protein